MRARWEGLGRVSGSTLPAQARASARFAEVWEGCERFATSPRARVCARVETGQSEARTALARGAPETIPTLPKIGKARTGAAFGGKGIAVNPSQTLPRRDS